MSWYEKTERAQRRVDERLRNIGSGRYARVLKMARKPSTDEYMKTVQIASLGLVLVGIAGFVIYLIWLQVPKLFDLF